MRVWEAAKNFYGQERIPFRFNRFMSNIFEFNREEKVYDPTSDDPHYYISNADIFMDSEPFSDEDPAWGTRYIGLVALVILRDKGGQVTYANAKPVSLPAGSYLAFLPRAYGSRTYESPVFSFSEEWAASVDDDYYYNISFFYDDDDDEFVLSSEHSNPAYKYYTPHIPQVYLVYKKKLTVENVATAAAEEKKAVLYFISKDEFIQKGKELGLLWEKYQEDQISSTIDAHENGFATPEACLEILYANGTRIDPWTIKTYGGLEKLIEVCGIKEEQKYHGMRFLVFEKIDASLIFDGDDIYWTRSSLINCLFGQCGIGSYERELFGIPKNNDQLEFYSNDEIE